MQAVEDEEMKPGNSCYQLVIVGGMSGRLDQTVHTLHVLWQLAPGVQVESSIPEPHEQGTEPPRGSTLKKRARTLVVSEDSVTCLISPGQHRLVHDRKILGKCCGILPLGVSSQEAHVHTSGLEWNLRMSAADHRR